MKLPAKPAHPLSRQQPSYPPSCNAQQPGWAMAGSSLVLPGPRLRMACATSGSRSPQAVEGSPQPSSLDQGLLGSSPGLGQQLGSSLAGSVSWEEENEYEMEFMRRYTGKQQKKFLWEGSGDAGTNRGAESALQDQALESPASRGGDHEEKDGQEASTWAGQTQAEAEQHSADHQVLAGKGPARPIRIIPLDASSTCQPGMQEEEDAAVQPQYRYLAQSTAEDVEAYRQLAELPKAPLAMRAQQRLGSQAPAGGIDLAGDPSLADGSSTRQQQGQQQGSLVPALLLAANTVSHQDMKSFLGDEQTINKDSKTVKCFACGGRVYMQRIGLLRHFEKCAPDILDRRVRFLFSQESTTLAHLVSVLKQKNNKKILSAWHHAYLCTDSSTGQLYIRDTHRHPAKVAGQLNVSLSRSISLLRSIKNLRPVIPDPGLLEVLYEDDALLAPSKPAGLQAMPTSMSDTNTLGNMVAHHLGSNSVHCSAFLAQSFSGVALFSKGDEPVQVDILSERYQAIVLGIPPQASGQITAPTCPHPLYPRFQIEDQEGTPLQTTYKLLASSPSPTFKAGMKNLRHSSLLLEQVLQLLAAVEALGVPLSPQQQTLYSSPPGPQEGQASAADPQGGAGSAAAALPGSPPPAGGSVGGEVEAGSWGPAAPAANGQNGSSQPASPFQSAGQVAHNQQPSQPISEGSSSSSSQQPTRVQIFSRPRYLQALQEAGFNSAEPSKLGLPPLAACLDEISVDMTDPQLPLPQLPSHVRQSLAGYLQDMGQRAERQAFNWYAQQRGIPYRDILLTFRGASLVECEASRGFSGQQLLVHMAAMGTPVLGDGARGYRTGTTPRLYAHLSELCFRQRSSGDERRVSAPLQQDFLEMLYQCDIEVQ